MIYNTPGYNTINRFRSEYLKYVVEDVFTQVLDFLHAKGYINFETYFIDGTRFEANANKHTCVWKKITVRYKEAVKERVKKLFEEIDRLNQQEDLLYGDNDSAERGIGKTITPEEIKETADKINNQLKAGNPKKARQKLSGERNSFFKTEGGSVFA